MLFGDDDERFSLTLIFSGSGLNRMDWYDGKNSLDLTLFTLISKKTNIVA